MTHRLILGAALGIAATIAVTLSLGGPAERAEANAPSDDYVAQAWNADAASELRCLALNVYWEARSEPLEGQLAVAAVTLNRTQDARFPSSVCDVVRDGGADRRHRCQFSWWCDGKSDEPLEIDAWRRAEMVAILTRAGVVPDPTKGALWYHADYVKPAWAKVKQITAQIGRHIFYVYPDAEPVQVSSR